MITSARGRFILFVVAIYALLALTWIFLSDQLLGAFADIHSIVWLSTAKGMFFVAASSALFFFALHTVPSVGSAPNQSILESMAIGVARLRRPRWLVYSFAIVITLTTLQVRQFIAPGVHDRPMFIMFMFPIIVSALLGGLGPGLVATAIAALGMDFLVLPPINSLYISNSEDLFLWVFLVVNGVAVSLLSEMLRRSLAKVEFNSRLLDSVVSGTTDAIFVKDTQGRYLMANAAVAEFVGKPQRTIVGFDDLALFSQSSAREVMAKDQATMASGRIQTYEEQVITKAGVALVFLSTKGPVFNEAGQLDGLFGISRDITERKAMEVKLQLNEQRLQMAIEATTDGMWDWDLRTGVVYRTPHYYEVTGYSPEEDTHDFEFFKHMVHPADLPSAIKNFEAHKRNLSANINFDFRLITSSGQTKWIKVRGRAVERDQQGLPVRIIGTLSDISEQKRTDEDLRLVLNEAGDAIWITDINGQFSFANPSACKLTGHSLKELQGLHIPELVHEHKVGELEQHLKLLESEKFIRREWSLNRKAGGVVSVELTTERLPDGRFMAFGRDLTERNLADAALLSREKQLARIIEGADQGYWDWNLVTNAFHVSARYETMLGYARGEMNIAVERWGDYVHPDDLSLAKKSLKQYLAGEIAGHQVELRCRTKQGEWRWILTQGLVVERNDDGSPLMMSGTHTDITERKNFELAQREAATVFTSSYEGIMVVDLAGNVTKINPAFSRITGYSAEEIVGHSPKKISSGRHDKAFYDEMWQSVRENDFWSGEIWNRRKNGGIYAELLSISVVRDAHGDRQHYIGVFSDISRLKEHEAELNQIAHFDPLTGVPNRRLLEDRFGQAIIRASRSGNSLAVCFLDLDGFKAVNDLYGHPAGDQLLVGVTRNLKDILRADDTLARLGGDEFVLLLSDICTPQECALVLDRILNAVGKPVQIDGKAISVSASIGVSLYPEDNVDADSLLRHADQAMYQAKEAGKNRYHLFDPESDRKAQQHRSFLELMRKALDSNEFVLYYQPKVDLRTGEIVGAEALIRWQHPEKGLLPPGEFLSHVYGSTFEKPLGEWVIDTALAQAARWHGLGLAISVSANVSANHLLQDDFCEGLKAALARHPEAIAAKFELEVLETAAIADIEQAVAVLHHCRELGVHFALDDFGTGYSSLTYLRKLPVDTLKIDQSFVRDMLNDADDLGIVEGVIRLAQAFKREVIAEGVETLEHGAALLNLGCPLAQGYGIARPMPAEQFLAWSARWKNEACWLTLNSHASHDQPLQ